ncbi:hypothetical protein HMPREF3224_02206, partial [Anaerococcus hydrogenalis]
MHATNINGAAMMNEKSAAALREMPSNKPPEMVEPLRENPGHNER